MDSRCDWLTFRIWAAPFGGSTRSQHPAGTEDPLLALAPVAAVGVPCGGQHKGVGGPPPWVVWFRGWAGGGSSVYRAGARHSGSPD